MKRLKKLLRPLAPTPVINLYHLLRAIYANLRYGFPARRLRVIAITGTNGKTTTANILAHILSQAGYKVGMSTTANFRIGDQEMSNELNMTTTDPLQLQRLLKQMQAADVDFVVLETTSHAVVQHRIWGIPIEIAVMTNLTQDHLDYHGTMEEYASAKAKILQRAKRTVVLNHDDEYFNFYIEKTGSHISYGTSKLADVRLKRAKLGSRGSDLTVDVRGQQLEAQFSLIGRFNVYNALAAISTADLLGVSAETIGKALKTAPHVPGRLEFIDEGQPFSVIVDYAHSPDAMKKLFESLRPLSKGRVICVFGATGDRDKGKRPQMLEVADQWCEHIIVTDDEPYSEDAAAIRAQVLDGANSVDHIEEIADRRAAIERGISLAKDKDMVAILGMGHQKYRVMNDGKVPWDDREVTRDILRNRAS